MLWSVILFGTAALSCVEIIRDTHRLVLSLAKKQPQSAEEEVDRLGLLAQLIGSVVVAVATISAAEGWLRGSFRYLVGGVLLLYVVGAPVYWFGGKRRLIAALQARATGDEPGA